MCVGVLAEAAGGGGRKIARAIPKGFGRQKITHRDGNVLLFDFYEFLLLVVEAGCHDS